MEKATLYHKGKAGETRVWSTWSEGSNYFSEYGVLGGELQLAKKTATPKNVGKKNETTAEQQADLEAKSAYKFKLDRKYSTTIESAKEELLLPMLAKDARDKIVFPAFIQPKFDGNRALAMWDGDKVKLISRSGKEWTVPKHINEQLEIALSKDCMFDGELYIHGKSLQTITSYVKKWREVETPLVEYHVYDMPLIYGKDDEKYSVRAQALKQEFQDCSIRLSMCPNIIPVLTDTVTNMAEVNAFESHMVAQGYEGAIVRNSDGLYAFGYRSNDLIKIKTFQDAEFEVLEVKEGKDSYAGCAIFTCKNDLNDKTFDCICAVPNEEKKQQFRDRESYIGRKLTVKFFNRTDDDLPFLPTGKLFRDPKDLS